MTVELLVPESPVDLVQGEEKKMATGSHSGIGAKLGRHLGIFAEEKDLGHVLDATATYNFQDGKPRRQPDISFISYEKLDELPNQELTVIPDLVAEVVSTNDTAFEINEKVVQYQNVGVKLIWIIYPDIRSVHVFRLTTGTKAEVKSVEDELDGETIVPGFKLPIKNLFIRVAAIY
jgi:Uma2 family endonuclease